MCPHIVGVAGGTASGKTTLTRQLLAIAGSEAACIVELDNYYRCQAHLPFEERVKANYDHPNAFEFELLLRDLSELRQGRAVHVPVYDFVSHTRHATQRRFVEPHGIVFVEGILTLTSPSVRERLDTMIFVDAPPEIRLARRMERDIRERGRTNESVTQQWSTTVYPMHQSYCEPTRTCADIIVDGTSFTSETVSALWNYIRGRIE